MFTKCHCCKRRRMTIECKYCHMIVCLACSHLETHSCNNISDKIQESKYVIANKLTDNKYNKQSIEFDQGNAY